jgi:hypothetical protein
LLRKTSQKLIDALRLIVFDNERIAGFNPLRDLDSQVSAPGSVLVDTLQPILKGMDEDTAQRKSAMKKVQEELIGVGVCSYVKLLYEG